jgi:hypothetical protein
MSGPGIESRVSFPWAARNRVLQELLQHRACRQKAWTIPEFEALRHLVCIRSVIMLIEECSPNWSFVTSACARGGRMLQHLLSPVAGGIRAKARPWEDLADTLRARWAGTILGRVARIVEPSTPYQLRIRQPWEDHMSSTSLKSRR